MEICYDRAYELYSWVSDYSNLGYIIHIHDPCFIYIINGSLVSFTNHVHKNFCSIIWFCSHVSDHVTSVIFSHDLSWPQLLLFGTEMCIIPQFSECLQVKKRLNKRTLLLATDEFLIFCSLIFLCGCWATVFGSTLF